MAGAADAEELPALGQARRGLLGWKMASSRGHMASLHAAVQGADRAFYIRL